ncbi:baseplate J/gp47 family protein [Novacetimonas pomaceti]|uniref:baseplate J/gp47 family protein n=1 Tax=Novacetimonas pomaceti TaxID=2021998 RepID=UPI001C2D8821|nr:baseplate J/gp47 family protein [Novacetimonas pomaceti]MBV1833091.1 baseplate J/gp47 family protein [Novacetimonas pomaceti]
MADTPTVNTSVPQPTFEDTGVLLPDDGDILTGVITDDNAAFGNALSYYDADGNFLVSRPQAQLATTKTAIINAVFGLIAYVANNVDPAVASGRMQDAIGYIYFLTRKPASATSVTGVCTGALGTVLPAGTKVQDTSGNTYASTAAATIGANGTVSVTFNCTETGPVSCPAGTLTTIYQIIPGWDSVTNPTEGITGADVESRVAFEARRSASVAANSVGMVDSIRAAVRSVSGVIDSYVVDNPTGDAVTVGSISMPAHSLLVVVAGGVDADIGAAILQKKPPGVTQVGNTTVTVIEPNSAYATAPSYAITFQRAVSAAIYVQVTLTNSTSVPSDATAQVQDACLSSFEGEGVEETSQEVIGQMVRASGFYPDVQALGAWTNIVNIKVSTDGTTWADTVTPPVPDIPTLVSGNISVVLQ